MESVHPSTAIDRQASAESSTTSRRNRWSRSSSSPRCGPSTSLGCCRCSRCVLLSVVGMANHRKTIGKLWFNGIYMGFVWDFGCDLGWDGKNFIHCWSMFGWNELWKPWWKRKTMVFTMVFTPGILILGLCLNFDRATGWDGSRKKASKKKSKTNMCQVCSCSWTCTSYTSTWKLHCLNSVIR